MGMFDWINFEMDCPKCGELVTGFQSKDAGEQQPMFLLKKRLH